MNWKVIDTGARSAAANMELDAALLSDLKEEREGILHFYDWQQEAATYGHFIEPSQFLNLDAASQKKLDLARRPTGGGIIFHHCDLAFSVLVPAHSSDFSHNPLENYAFVNQRVIWALEDLVGTQASLLPTEPQPLDAHCKSFCMAKPTKYDVMVKGKKVGGASQRKTKYGFLHQGSIAIGLPSETYLEEVLIHSTKVIEGIRQNGFALLGSTWSQKELAQLRIELRHRLKEAFLK